MLEDEGAATVPYLKNTNEELLNKKGHSTTTTTTTVLTKTWLLGFPRSTLVGKQVTHIFLILSGRDDLQVKEYEEDKEIRKKFADLTKSTDALLRELDRLTVVSCEKERCEEQTVFATNTRTPYKYSREVIVSPTKHQKSFLTEDEYPHVTITRKNINSNPFIDSADLMSRDTCQPDPPVQGYPGLLSPQLHRKTYPGQSSTLPPGGQGRGRTMKLTEEDCFARDEATQTTRQAKKKCLTM